MKDSNETTQSSSDEQGERADGVEQSVPTPVIEVDSASSEILNKPVDDAVCLQCGYALRGLLPTGNCPECGSPVGLSLQGDALVFADPDYIKRLLLGIRIILIGLLIALVFVVLLAIGGWMTGAVFNGQPTFTVLILKIFYYAGIGGIFLSGLLVIAGFWMVLIADPGEVQKSAFPPGRVWGQWLMIPALLSWMLSIPGAGFGSVIGFLTQRIPAILSIICFWLVASHCLKIAKRLREKVLFARVRLFRVFGVLILVCSMLCLPLTVIAGIAGFGGLVWLWELVFDYRVRLRRVLALSVELRENTQQGPLELHEHTETDQFS